MQLALRALSSPSPGKLGVNLLEPCQNVDIYETNQRDHDFGI